MPDRIHDIFISVAEDSADIHAAALMRARGEHLPHARFHGLTGPRLRALGARTVFDMTRHAAMLTGVFSVIGKARAALRAIEQSWDRRRPDLVVLLDSPELHLRVARRAKERGIPVLYYIAPQTWGSRSGRNAEIRRIVDQLACILPFEEQYFRDVNVNAEFVGHPLFETLNREQPDAATVAHLRAGPGSLIALLPGSRRHVIDAVLPHQLRIVRALRRSGRDVRVAISAVAEDRVAQIREHAAKCTDHQTDVEIVVADNASLLTAADLVLVASGTATLQVAHYRKPMIVLYDAGTLIRGLYPVLGRFVVKTPHLSLVNILAGRRVVPEFMPIIPAADQVARVAAELLDDQSWRSLMSQQLDEVVRPLETTSASENVCGMMSDLLNTQHD